MGLETIKSEGKENRMDREPVDDSHLREATSNYLAMELVGDEYYGVNQVSNRIAGAVRKTTDEVESVVKDLGENDPRFEIRRTTLRPNEEWEIRFLNKPREVKQKSFTTFAAATAEKYED